MKIKLKQTYVLKVSAEPATLAHFSLFLTKNFNAKNIKIRRAADHLFCDEKSFGTQNYQFVHTNLIWVQKKSTEV